jgi:transcriptional regulator GlxA family with amidase domain
MDVAIVLYDNFTALDAIGPYEVLSRLRDTRVTFVAQRPGPVSADTGMLSVLAEALTDLPHPDLVLVPGGPGQEQQLGNEVLADWLRAADATASWTTSVCTGSLLLAAAGLLAGRRATSHWLALDRLADYQARPVSERVVIDGKYITCAGVSAGIDMALGLAGRIGGQGMAQAIQLMIEYDPQPPYQAGSPRTAPPDVVRAMRLRSRHTAAEHAAG